MTLKYARSVIQSEHMAHSLHIPLLSGGGVASGTGVYHLSLDGHCCILVFSSHSLWGTFCSLYPPQGRSRASERQNRKVTGNNLMSVPGIWDLKGVLLPRASGGALQLKPSVLVTSRAGCICLLFLTQLMACLSVSVCVLQASSGVKQWNKRWFVLVDRCLFYYKGE